jgi:hypothetical protein
MASMKDALARLAIIYETCSPEGIAASTTDKGVDEFTRLKSKINRQIKVIHQFANLLGL